MKFKLKVWRQAGPNQPGRFKEYEVNDVIPEMSLLDRLDNLNED